MDTALGLAGPAVFIVCVIGLAAAVTAIVVKLSPGNRDRQPKQPA